MLGKKDDNHKMSQNQISVVTVFLCTTVNLYSVYSPPAIFDIIFIQKFFIIQKFLVNLMKFQYLISGTNTCISFEWMTFILALDCFLHWILIICEHTL